MARDYPRFLYDNVQGTKSDGEYIMHLLEPRVLLKVQHMPKGQLCVICIDEMEHTPKLGTILQAAEKWYRSVVKSRGK